MNPDTTTMESMVALATPPRWRPAGEQAYQRVVGIYRVGNSIIARFVCGHSIRLPAYIPIPIFYAPPCFSCMVGARPERWYRAH